MDTTPLMTGSVVGVQRDHWMNGFPFPSIKIRSDFLFLRSFSLPQQEYVISLRRLMLTRLYIVAIDAQTRQDVLLCSVSEAGNPVKAMWSGVLNKYIARSIA
jgi:hypothetical protein